MAEVEIGGTKRGRIAYSFDDIALVPTRRTRNPEEVSTSWKIDAYEFEFPIMAAPMDSVVSPEVAINYGKLGGLAVLNLEGLWTRYEDPKKEFKKILDAKPESGVQVLQQIYSAEIKPELIKERIKEIKAGKANFSGNPEDFMKHIVLNEQTQNPNYVGQHLTQTPFPGAKLSLKSASGDTIAEKKIETFGKGGGKIATELLQKIKQ